MKKLLSRKLWVAVSSLAAVIYAATTKELSWGDAVPSIAAIVIGYCVAQGWIDAKQLDSAIEAQEPEAPAPSEDG